VSRDRLRAFHERRLELLAASAVDLLAFETIPSLEEAGVLTELLDQHPGVQVWFSFTCRDERHLSDGSDFTDAVQLCAGHDAVVAVGVNCSDPRVVPGLIAAASEHTHRPLIAYPNSGEVYDAGRRTWMGPPAGETWMSCALATLEAGATILGGCCRVGPDTIAQLRRRADDRHWGTDPLSRDDS
jgi:homocysteine S-methyltransferase